MNELSILQTNVFLFIKKWAEIQKTPIPRKEIITYMETNGVKSYNCVNALGYLLKKEFIRTAYSEKQNQTFYVMIRNI